MTKTVTETAVESHYGKPDRAAKILDALKAVGIEAPNITVEDLQPLDQFHIGGVAATIELGKLANLHAGERVIDVGGGIGGPARAIASMFGVDVTVVDLTAEFCTSGERLTKLVGYDDRVRFTHASALELPFLDQSFDVGWAQFVSMNIENKMQLYREKFRVTRPGGRIAFIELMAGPNTPITFPVPWAPEPSISFLKTPDEIRSLLGDLGFVERSWNDTTEQAIAFFDAAAARTAAEGPPALSLAPLIGPALIEASRNLKHNIEEGRVVPIQAVFDRP